MINIPFFIVEEGRNFLFFNTFVVEQGVAGICFLVYLLAVFFLFLVLSVNDYDMSDVGKSLWVAFKLVTGIVVWFISYISLALYFG